MSERTEQKLRHVVLAQYQFRHEAEFAAGFLDDAGIPYRLQVDDAVLGMAISTPATIWVRGMDAARAREILELPEPRGGSFPVRSEDRAAEPAPADDASGPGLEGSRPETIALRYSSDSVGPRTADRERLTWVERTVSFALLIAAIVGATLARPLPGGPAWLVLAAVVGWPLALAAFAGRAIAPVRRLLRAISGEAP